jgi:hypothetical protein
MDTGDREAVTVEEMLTSVFKLIGESPMIPKRLDWDNPKIRSMADRSAMDLRGWRDKMSKDEYVLFTFAKSIHDTALMAPGLVERDGFDGRTIMHIISLMSVIPQIILELMDEELDAELMADLGIVDPEVGE